MRSIDQARHRARVILNRTQFDAWVLVKFDAMPKRKVARQLCIARSTLDGRLESANRLLLEDEVFIRHMLEAMVNGELAISPGFAPSASDLQERLLEQTGGDPGAKGAGGVDRRRDKGVQAA